MEVSACQCQYVQSLNLENSNWVENIDVFCFVLPKKMQRKSCEKQKTVRKEHIYYSFLFLCICHFLMASSVVPFLWFFGVFSIHLFSMWMELVVVFLKSLPLPPLVSQYHWSFTTINEISEFIHMLNLVYNCKYVRETIG